MSTIRRLYLYAVTLISLVVITWGLIGLARSAFAGDEIGDDVAQLAGALALIFVGIPVFLLHWLLAQRGAYRDDQERFSYIRAVFLYGALLVTLIPVVQNLMALVNRGFFVLFDLSNNRTMFGFEQTWSDNLIAILMNAVIAAYIFSVLRKDWVAGPTGNAFVETRRLYRYIWVLYGLAMTIGGVQQSLLFIFDTLEETAIASQWILANGLTLILVGTPIWVLSWRIVQKSIVEYTEQESLLRAAILFVVSLVGMVITLLTGGTILSIIFQIILGMQLSFAGLMGELRDPISAVIPFGITWAYFSHVRRKDLAAADHISQQLNSVQQIYGYLSAFLGLGTFFISLQQLSFFIIELSVEKPIWSKLYREQLSIAIAILMIGLPLWFLNWRKVTKRVSLNGNDLNQTRSSLTRKVYLYLVLFIGVMGVMISAGVLIFQVLQAILGHPNEELLLVTLELASLLILFFVVIWYHGQVLRSDGHWMIQAQAKQQAEFPILVLVSELGSFSQAVVAALSREAPAMPVAVHVVGQGVPDEALSDAKAVILPAIIAANPGEAIRLWLQNFPGVRFVVPAPVERWIWVSGNSNPLQNLAAQTAEMVRKLAEGVDISKTRSSSPWLIFGYIMGGVVGLVILLISISILVDVLNY